MPIQLYRVQHRTDGRGPYRPGFSAKWSDPDEHPFGFKSWIEEFGLEKILSERREGEYLGCGCRDLATIRQWFSASEFERLRSFGYRVVLLNVDRVLAESPCQVVFARRLPLHLGALPLNGIEVVA